MSLLSFFMWCENSAIGDAIRNSKWLFPFIEAIHLLGLAIIGGAVLVVDLRLFGVDTPNIGAPSDLRKHRKSRPGARLGNPGRTAYAPQRWRGGPLEGPPSP